MSFERVETSRRARSAAAAVRYRRSTATSCLRDDARSDRERLARKHAGQLRWCVFVPTAIWPIGDRRWHGA